MVIVVVVAVILVVVVLLLLLQIYYHEKSGGPSFKIDRVMAILGWLKFLQRTYIDRLTDYHYKVMR